MLKKIKYHIENPQILDAKFENLFATATWRPEFVQPCPKRHELVGL
jgi:hypothetical protein